MDTQNLIVGSRVEHPVHGAGTVTFVGIEHLGIAFDDGGEALLRRATLEEEPAMAAPAPPASRHEARPWPESTFVPEDDHATHSMGSHWEPFAEDSSAILQRLPDIVPQALVQTGFGEHRKPARVEPEDWPQGAQLVWPLRVQGLALILRPGEAGTDLVSLFPFCTTGSQHTLSLRAVRVWENGLEAQITASWGEGEVTFYDSQYLINRLWYETGRNYDFILTGMAYTAGPAEPREFQLKRHPDQVAWLNQRLPAGEEPFTEAYTMSLEGSAMFLPVTDWDEDDYSFHAPVKSVIAFQDWLGEDGWRVRATVMRFGDEDADLDIMITRRAWTGQTPPEVGQDIEGRLWLQGYLWMPLARNGAGSAPQLAIRSDTVFRNGGQHAQKSLY